MQERIISDDIDIKYIYCREDADNKIKQNDYQGAIEEYSAFLTILNKKGHPEVYEGVLIDTIKCREAIEDYQGMLKDYNELINLKPNDAYFLCCRAITKQKLNDFMGAKNDYLAALNKDPNEDQRVMIHVGIGGLEMEQGNFETGFNYLQKNINQKEIKNDSSHEQQKDSTESNFSRQLKELEHDIIHSNLSLSELNKRFQKLENEALQIKSVDFYLLRAHFYDVSAQHDKSKVRQETLYRKALQDYHQALNIDPFVDEAPEKIEEIEELLQKLQLTATTNMTLFAQNEMEKFNVIPNKQNNINSSMSQKK